MDATTPKPPTMRELMPKGHLPLLMKATGCQQRGTLSDVALYEQNRSKYWPAVLALAEKTDPEGFARWAAANPEKLPAKAAA